MTQNADPAPAEEKIPEAEVQTRKGISIIWIVPLVALAIGGWLAFKALSEKGPTVTITFLSAEGLEAGKTKIRYKNVEVGQVEDIRLSEDLSHVVVTAKMVKESAGYLTENTRFWVVRARVAAGEVSGLETLFSGAYIGIDPGQQGKPARHFRGLEVPPVITTETPGKQFLLKAESLSSLDIGSPVYFRKIKVGQVVSYELGEDNLLDVRIFIDAPHDQRVRENTVFWNASGIDLTLDPGGLEINTESLVSILLGGIAFDLPAGAGPAEPARENAVFNLFASREKTTEKSYARKEHFLLYFKDTVRGLVPGAPVEFRGIKLGEVIDVDLEFEMAEMEFRIPVHVVIEPERINPRGPSPEEQYSVLNTLVEKGLRGQLKTGNLLTGQLFVDLDIDPDAPPARMVFGERYPVIPTTPSIVEKFTETLDRVMARVEKFPLEQIGQDLQKTIRTLNQSLQELQSLVRNVNSDVTPRINQTLVDLQRTLDDIQSSLGTDSPLNYNTNKAMDELTLTLRSLRNLTDSLERNPQSIIFGRQKEEP